MSVQKAQKRGKINYNWLKGYHYLSFGSYYNPLQTNYGPILAFSQYGLEKLEQFEKVNIKNLDVLTLVFKGELRQNNTIQEKNKIVEGNMLKLNSYDQDLEFQNQNSSDQEILDMLQIYISNKNTQQLKLQQQQQEQQQQEQQQQQQQSEITTNKQNKMEIIDFQQFNEVNVKNSIFKSEDQLYELSLIHIQNDHSLVIENNNKEINGFYIFVKKGSIKIQQKCEQGKIFELQQGDIYQSFKGEQIEITGQKQQETEISNLIVLDVQIQNSDLYSQL